jgi:hypothetical protein
VRRYTDMTYCNNYSTPLTGHSLGSTATYSSTSWDSTANSGYPETAPPSGSQTYNQYNWPSRIDADSHSAVNNFGGSQQDVTETPYGAGHHQHWQSQPLWPVQQQLDNWQQYEGNRGARCTRISVLPPPTGNSTEDTEEARCTSTPMLRLGQPVSSECL